MLKLGLKNDIEDAELGLYSYHIFRKDKKLSKEVTRGGGVLVAVRKNLECCECKFNFDISEYLDQKFVCVYKRNNKYIIGGVYIPPDLDVGLYQEVGLAIEDLSSTYS